MPEEDRHCTRAIELKAVDNIASMNHYGVGWAVNGEAQGTVEIDVLPNLPLAAGECPFGW